MRSTDFDLLNLGVTAEEAKRLRQLLAEWSKGDDNSFPVQIALVTKAQWKAATHVATTLVTERKEIERLFKLYAQESATSQKNASDAIVAKAKEIEAEFARQTLEIRELALQIGKHLDQVERAASQVLVTLNDGRQAYEAAKRDFDAEAKDFQEAAKDLHARIRVRDWLTAGLFSLLLLGVGVLLGFSIDR